jgi:class 3 adenylate cyclase
MGKMLAAQGLDVEPFPGPVHRLIVVVDIEGSTKRTNPVKGHLRRDLYELLGRALQSAGITARHLERHTDRGDGVLILIRPHDDVPKTLVLGRLMPILAALLIERNASVTQPELRLRLRAVVHAGEVHSDDRGFYGDDIDAACRLLDAPKLRRALRDAVGSPLVLAISDEIYTGIVQHGYLNAGPYRPLGRIRVGNRSRRGWMHVPAPLDPDHSSTTPARVARRQTRPWPSPGRPSPARHPGFVCGSGAT